MSADNRVITPNYYEVMGIPLLRGRAFTEQDAAEQPGVIIVNETMARRTWPDEDPIGKRIIVYLAGREFPVSVVGVVADSRQMTLEQPVAPEMNFPVAQFAQVLAAIQPRGSHAGGADQSRACDPRAPSGNSIHNCRSIISPRCMRRCRSR